MLFKDVPLRTKRGVIAVYKIYGNRAFLILIGTALTPFWHSANNMNLVKTSEQQISI